MKGKAILLALSVCLAAATCSFADDAFSGTWKLDEVKSKLSPGMSKNTTVTYAASATESKSYSKVSDRTAKRRMTSGRANTTGKTIR